MKNAVPRDVTMALAGTMSPAGRTALPSARWWKKWKASAEEGEHDDLVMSLGIAHMISGQQRRAVEVNRNVNRKQWTADMWEDYRNAGEDLKRVLREKWGEPM